jgi:hypothetical protein
VAQLSKEAAAQPLERNLNARTLPQASRQNNRAGPFVLVVSVGAD